MGGRRSSSPTVIGPTQRTRTTARCALILAVHDVRALSGGRPPARQAPASLNRLQYLTGNLDPPEAARSRCVTNALHKISTGGFADVCPVPRARAIKTIKKRRLEVFLGHGERCRPPCAQTHAPRTVPAANAPERGRQAPSSARLCQGLEPFKGHALKQWCCDVIRASALLGVVADVRTNRIAHLRIRWINSVKRAAGRSRSIAETPPSHQLDRCARNRHAYDKA